MDWEKVAASLENEYHSLKERADYAFGGDFATQREMRTRAMIAFMLADALRAGIVRDDKK